MSKSKGKRDGGGEPVGQQAKDDLGFEEALTRLEELVSRLEGGDLPLEETIRTFEEAQKHLRLCTGLLEKAEQRVKEILRQADGSIEEREREGQEDASV